MNKNKIKIILTSLVSYFLFNLLNLNNISASNVLNNQLNLNLNSKPESFNANLENKSNVLNNQLNLNLNSKPESFNADLENKSNVLNNQLNLNLNSKPESFNANLENKSNVLNNQLNLNLNNNLQTNSLKLNNNVMPLNFVFNSNIVNKNLNNDVIIYSNSKFKLFKNKNDMKYIKQSIYDLKYFGEQLKHIINILKRSLLFINSNEHFPSSLPVRAYFYNIFWLPNTEYNNSEVCYEFFKNLYKEFPSQFKSFLEQLNKNKINQYCQQYYFTELCKKIKIENISIITQYINNNFIDTGWKLLQCHDYFKKLEIIDKHNQLKLVDNYKHYKLFYDHALELKYGQKYQNGIFYHIARSLISEIYKICSYVFVETIEQVKNPTNYDYNLRDNIEKHIKKNIDILFDIANKIRFKYSYEYEKNKRIEKKSSKNKFKSLDY